MVDAGSEFQALRGHIHQLWIALMRVKQRVCEVDARSRLHEAGRTPALPVRFRAQYGEDAAIWDIFDGATTGFFIEAGAFDGVQLSVTYSLESMGWRGLLVEAIPERAAECRANRPGSRVVHAALGRRGASGAATFHVSGQGQGTDGMLSSLRTDQAANPRPVQVPHTSLATLLADYRGEIDLLVLDVEGSEKDALDGLDLGRHRPRLIMVEDNSFGDDSALRAQINGAGYTMCGRLSVNWFYARSDLAPLVERARAVLTF